MPNKGKHRRVKSRSLPRSVAVVGAGGAALVLPVIAATSANAAGTAATGSGHKAGKAASGAVSAAAQAERDAAEKKYTVVSGDSLFKIADKHSLEGGWRALYKSNKKAVGDNPSLIRPGLKLTIPVPGKGQREEPAPSRSEKREEAKSPASKTYSNDLDGWIKEALDVMAKHDIPGTYDGIHRNIMRESSGNPQAINNWDSNAAKGTPSKGLLQVIDPTFAAYHVPGTPYDPYDPVANITAACNYAADNYGSIDNVNGPY
ncbi:LysM peptidoglycan-binding domain-containing protein [Streptomyces sp. NA04227]|uniref:transglycosylase SLT domain-containing protein n=1 Tax=Streptomyces sp. NA04227 TaxID=2742136 RepID=UPI0015907685|nr:LysM peptidoglycan-binding domain-containing protein [Streptomyces sp. NA04227]QKW10519.1 LysM peptidoglycan-binding domain-containing protein [Streptomyces sp. NA04227]